MTDCDAIAGDLLARRAEGRALEAGGARPRVTGLAEALAVQDAIEARMVARGARPIGYKIGATSQLARDALDVAEPFRGRLYDATSSEGGSTVLREAHFQVWEVEIALRLATDLDPAGAPFKAVDFEAATAALIPAIEIVGSVWRPFNRALGLDLIADNAVHGHWIRGAEVTDWSGIDLAGDPIALIVDGERKAAGKGANVDGGPFGSTAWLANHLARQGRGLKAGDYVTTGTVTPLVPIGDDHQVAADFGPLGRVQLTLGQEPAG